ncbi:MAG: fumarylacetoacetate hydrolase family protein, partial [Methanobacteriota archaeon]
LALVDACGSLSGPTWALARRIVARADKAARGRGARFVLPRRSVRIRAPIVPRLLRDFIAFRAHIARTREVAGSRLPPEWDLFPAYYNGAHTAVVGPGEDVRMPRFPVAGPTRTYADTAKLDYEAEVGFVLGRGGRDITLSRAAGCLFGVTIFNDFSARDIQFTVARVGMGPGPGKDFANALGPCIVTRDEFGALDDKRVVVRVNGSERIRGVYGDMVHKSPYLAPGERALWSFPEMVEIVSRSQPVHPGEVWGSGTIPGACELERGEAARYLAPGDVVEVEIEEIGVLGNRIVPSA